MLAVFACLIFHALMKYEEAGTVIQVKNNQGIGSACLGQKW